MSYIYLFIIAEKYLNFLRVFNFADVADWSSSSAHHIYMHIFLTLIIRYMLQYVWI